MLVIKYHGENIPPVILLSEAERVSLASQEAIDFVNERIKEIEKYVGTNLDFFTGLEIEEGNEWLFNVNKDGKLYTCKYDNEDTSLLEGLAKEARYFLMWRYGGSGWYTEHIGDAIIDGTVITVQETTYDEVKEKLEGLKNFKGKDGYESVEEIELTELNREEIRQFYLAL